MSKLLLIGFRIRGEAVMNGLEASVHVGDDSFKFRVFGAGE